MKTLFLSHGKTSTPNKYWEFEGLLSAPIYWKYWNVQILIDTEHVFRFEIALGALFQLEIDWTKKRDHAGIRASFNLLGLEITYTIYDCRHWDENTEDWQKH